MKQPICLILLFLIFSSFTGVIPGKTKVMWLTDSKGKKLRKEAETTYNAQGDIIKEIGYDEGVKPSCQKYTYTYLNGHKIKRVMSFCDNKTYDITTYIYDSEGRPTQEITYDSKHKQQSKKVHLYSGTSKNKYATESFTGVEKDSFSRDIFKYYPNNLVKSIVQNVAGTWNMTQNFKYDANNNLIYEDGEVDGGVGVVKHYYTYKNNVLIKEVIKVPDTGTEYHAYEYLP